jgi:hypothetical protein
VTNLNAFFGEVQREAMAEDAMGMSDLGISNDRHLDQGRNWPNLLSDFSRLLSNLGKPGVAGELTSSPPWPCMMKVAVGVYTSESGNKKSRPFYTCSIFLAIATPTGPYKSRPHSDLQRFV